MIRPQHIRMNMYLFKIIVNVNNLSKNTKKKKQYNNLKIKPSHKLNTIIRKSRSFYNTILYNKFSIFTVVFRYERAQGNQSNRCICINFANLQGKLRKIRRHRSEIQISRHRKKPKTALFQNQKDMYRRTQKLQRFEGFHNNTYLICTLFRQQPDWPSR